MTWEEAVKDDGWWAPLKDFFKTAGMAFFALNSKGEFLYREPRFNPFCHYVETITQLAEQSKVGRRSICQTVLQTKKGLYKPCLFGLATIVVPIEKSGTLYGCIGCCGGRPTVWDPIPILKKSAREYNLDEDKLIEFLDQMPRLDEDFLKDALSLLQVKADSLKSLIP